MAELKKITNEEIYNLIMDLGSNIPDDFIWSDTLRKKFEEVTSYLNSLS